MQASKSKAQAPTRLPPAQRGGGLGKGPAPGPHLRIEILTHPEAVGGKARAASPAALEGEPGVSYRGGKARFDLVMVIHLEPADCGSHMQQDVSQSFCCPPLALSLQPHCLVCPLLAWDES